MTGLFVLHLDSTMGGGTGGGGDRSPAIFSTFNIVPIGFAWKASTSNGPRPPRCGAAPVPDKNNNAMTYVICILLVGSTSLFSVPKVLIRFKFK